MSDTSQELPWLNLDAGQPILFEISDELTQNDEDRYRVSEFLGRGGSGEVYRLNSERHGPNRVAKIYLPFFYFDRLNAIFRSSTTPPEVSDHFFREHDSMRIGDREYSALAAVSHPYIVSVHDLKQVVLGRKARERLANSFGLRDAPEIVYSIIGSYVSGSRISDFSRAAAAGDTIAALHGVAVALDYLNFEREILHCDVKPDNIIINDSKLPVLVDFGLAQRRAGGETRFFSVPESLRPADPPAKARKVLQKLEAASSVKISEIWDAFAPWLDRFQYGLLLRRLAADPRTRLFEAERAFLAEVAARLTDLRWLQQNRQLLLGDLIGRAHSDRAYPLVRAAAREGDLRFPSPFRPINVPTELQEFATHPALARLNRVNQLGLLPVRFPGATHTRYLHSLDTYRIARSLVRRLVDRPRFRTIMGPDDVKRLLVAAMYHDINHLPLLHVFQEFRQKEDWPDPFDLGCRVTATGSRPLGELLAEVGSSLDHLRALVKPEEARNLLGRKPNEAEALTSSLVASGVDVDKLSYLQLDSMFSGLGFASALDLDRLFEIADVTMARDGATERPVVSFSRSQLDAVEAVVRARWLGFRDLYWCDENRAMMAAVLDVVRRIVSHSDGAKRLKALFEESVALSDHVLLLRLDRIADDLGVGRYHLADFFDGLWNVVGLASVLEDRKVASALRNASASTRATIDSRFGEEVRALAGRSREGPELVAIDVPERNLDLGGEVWVHSGDGTVPADFGHEYQARFDRMSARIGVFADRKVIEEITRGRTDTTERVRDLLVGVIESVSKERGWD